MLPGYEESAVRPLCLCLSTACFQLIWVLPRVIMSGLCGECVSCAFQCRCMHCCADLSFPVMVQWCGQWIISMWWTHCFCRSFLLPWWGAPFYTCRPSGWEKIEFYFNLLLIFHWFLQCWLVKFLYPKTWKYNTEEVLESMVRAEFLFLFSKDGGYPNTCQGKMKIESYSL